MLKTSQHLQGVFMAVGDQSVPGTGAPTPSKMK